MSSSSILLIELIAIPSTDYGAMPDFQAILLTVHCYWDSA